MEASIYTKFFLVALFIKSLIESILDKRNMDHIINIEMLCLRNFKIK